VLKERFPFGASNGKIEPSVSSSASGLNVRKNRYSSAINDCGYLACRQRATFSIMENTAIASWSITAGTAIEADILPDGCRDLILCVPPDTPPRWMLSPLDRRVRKAQVKRGTMLHGFRLRPGLLFDEAAVLGILNANPPVIESGLDILGSHARQSTVINDALDSLASRDMSVRNTAATLGMSTRQLQRLMIAETGQTPLFWHRLARARRAARALYGAASLTDVAYDFGYYDQSHMNREFCCWFGLTPKQLRLRSDWLPLITAPGYA